MWLFVLLGDIIIISHATWPEMAFSFLVENRSRYFEFPWIFKIIPAGDKKEPIIRTSVDGQSVTIAPTSHYPDKEPPIPNWVESIVESILL